MSDEEIVSTLAKGKDRCHRVLQLYKNMRGGMEAVESGVSQQWLESADRMLTQMLAQLRAVPGRPVAMVHTSEAKDRVRQILAEMSDLMECVIVADREMREAHAGEGEQNGAVSHHRPLNASFSMGWSALGNEA